MKNNRMNKTEIPRSSKIFIECFDIIALDLAGNGFVHLVVALTWSSSFGNIN